VGAAGVDLVDEVLHADDAVLAQLLQCFEEVMGSACVRRRGIKE